MLYRVKVNLVLKMYSGEYHIVSSDFKDCTKPFTEEEYNSLVSALVKAGTEQYGEPVDSYFPATDEQIARLDSKRDFFYFTNSEEVKIALKQMKEYYQKIQHTLGILKKEKEGRPEEERKRYEEKYGDIERLFADIDFVRLFLENKLEDVDIDSVEQSLDNVIGYTSEKSIRNWNSVLRLLKDNL